MTLSVRSSMEHAGLQTTTSFNRLSKGNLTGAAETFVSLEPKGMKSIQFQRGANGPRTRVAKQSTSPIAEETQTSSKKGLKSGEKSLVVSSEMYKTITNHSLNSSATKIGSFDHFSIGLKQGSSNQSKPLIFPSAHQTMTVATRTRYPITTSSVMPSPSVAKGVTREVVPDDIGLIVRGSG